MFGLNVLGEGQIKYVINTFNKQIAGGLPFFCPVEVTLVNTIDCGKNVSLFRADCFTAELNIQQEMSFYV